MEVATHEKHRCGGSRQEDIGVCIGGHVNPDSMECRSQRPKRRFTQVVFFSLFPQSISSLAITC